MKPDSPSRTRYSMSGAARDNTAPEGDWLDASKYDTFSLCPTKYYWRYEEHLVPLDESSDLTTGMQFGHAIHKSLESLYTAKAFDLVPCPQPDCEFCKGSPIPLIAAEFLAAYPTEPTDDHNPRTRNRGLEVLEAYLTRWRREPFSVEAVEVPFELSFPDFKYIGRMDLIVRWDKSTMPMDHKTTSRFGMAFDQQFKMSTQITGYIVATSIVTGEPVNQALINAIRITTKIDPTESFHRIITTRTPEDIARWKEDVTHAIGRIRQSRETGFWPRSAPFACSAYNKTCEFYPLCTSGSATRETLKSTAYRVLPWNPHA